MSSDTEVRLTEIGNPVAIGWRWITEYEGVKHCYELCCFCNYRYGFLKLVLNIFSKIYNLLIIE